MLADSLENGTETPENQLDVSAQSTNKSSRTSRRPPTKRQILANRRNGRRTRGPATSRGKSTSALNALQHGLLSRKLVALPWENTAELAQLRDRMTAALQPQGEFESALVEEVINAAWKLARLDHMENGVTAYHFLHTLRQRELDGAASLESILDKELDGLSGDITAISDPARHAQHKQEAQRIEDLRHELLPTIGEAFVRDAEGPDALGKLRRYRTAIANDLYRAYHELQRVQAARQGATVPLPAAVDIGVSIGTPPAEDGSELT